MNLEESFGYSFNLIPIEIYSKVHSSENKLKEKKIYNELVNYFLDKFSKLNNKDQALVETVNYMTKNEFLEKCKQL